MEETEFESLRTALIHYDIPQRKREIVDELEADNKKFILIIQNLRREMSQKLAYRKIQTMQVWKGPRMLLKEYYTNLEGILKCKHCKKVLTKSFTMHHSMYNDGNFLNPLYIEIICNGCHARHHRGDHRE